MARQGAEPRAGHIQQHPIKTFSLPIGEIGGIGGFGANAAQPQALGIELDLLQPPWRHIHSHHLALITHQFSDVGGLPARGSAGIEHPLAGLGI